MPNSVILLSDDSSDEDLDDKTTIFNPNDNGIKRKILNVSLNQIKPITKIDFCQKYLQSCQKPATSDLSAQKKTPTNQSLDTNQPINQNAKRMLSPNVLIDRQSTIKETFKKIKLNLLEKIPETNKSISNLSDVSSTESIKSNSNKILKNGNNFNQLSDITSSSDLSIDEIVEIEDSDDESISFLPNTNVINEITYDIAIASTSKQIENTKNDTNVSSPTELKNENGKEIILQNVSNNDDIIPCIFENLSTYTRKNSPDHDKNLSPKSNKGKSKKHRSKTSKSKKNSKSNNNNGKENKMKHSDIENDMESIEMENEDYERQRLSKELFEIDEKINKIHEQNRRVENNGKIVDVNENKIDKPVNTEPDFSKNVDPMTIISSTTIVMPNIRQEVTDKNLLKTDLIINETETNYNHNNSINKFPNSTINLEINKNCEEDPELTELISTLENLTNQPLEDMAKMSKGEINSRDQQCQTDFIHQEFQTDSVHQECQTDSMSHMNNFSQTSKILTTDAQSETNYTQLNDVTTQTNLSTNDQTCQVDNIVKCSTENNSTQTVHELKSQECQTDVNSTDDLSANNSFPPIIISLFKDQWSQSVQTEYETKTVACQTNEKKLTRTFAELLTTLNNNTSLKFIFSSDLLKLFVKSYNLYLIQVKANDDQLNLIKHISIEANLIDVIQSIFETYWKYTCNYFKWAFRELYVNVNELNNNDKKIFCQLLSECVLNESQNINLPDNLLPTESDFVKFFLNEPVLPKIGKILVPKDQLILLTTNIIENNSSIQEQQQPVEQSLEQQSSIEEQLKAINRNQMQLMQNQNETESMIRHSAASVQSEIDMQSLQPQVAVSSQSFHQLQPELNRQSYSQTYNPLDSLLSSFEQPQNNNTIIINQTHVSMPERNLQQTQQKYIATQYPQKQINPYQFPVQNNIQEPTPSNISTRESNTNSGKTYYLITHHDANVQQFHQNQQYNSINSAVSNRLRPVQLQQQPNPLQQQLYLQQNPQQNVQLTLPRFTSTQQPLQHPIQQQQLQQNQLPRQQLQQNQLPRQQLQPQQQQQRQIPHQQVQKPPQQQSHLQNFAQPPARVINRRASVCGITPRNMRGILSQSSLSTENTPQTSNVSWHRPQPADSELMKLPLAPRGIKPKPPAINSQFHIIMGGRNETSVPSSTAGNNIPTPTHLIYHPNT